MRMSCRVSPSSSVLPSPPTERRKEDAALHGPELSLLKESNGGTTSNTTSAAPRESLFSVGRNCCVVGAAHRVGLVVDGEAYFRTFMDAALLATRSIAILAWDFNSSTRLRFDDAEEGPPVQLGDFLNWLVRRRRGLQIHVLDWDYPLVYGTDREFRPLYGFGWRPHRRIHIAYDNTHPLSASHHQKIVVIDDALAFIGGLDLTARRWDTCTHAANDERRTYCGKPYPPFHDLMMAVDGDAAREMGTIVRRRWLAATGRPMPPAPARPLAAPWPESLAVDIREVDVALSQTMPELPDRPGITEVEALYLDIIAAARQSIYIENQYFTAHRIGEALAARLAEPDGPEIIVVVRLFSHGWLEEHTMHVLRSRLVQRLRAADVHGRFHIHYPHIDGLPDGICIDLHSKLMIVDDEILRIGSANLCNRSMGMDSECDASIEARGDPKVAAAIHAFRNRLLGEHLDTPPEAVEAAIQEHGNLQGAIEALGGRQRTLRPLEQVPDWSPAVIELASVGDPARPVSLEQLIDEFSPERFISGDENGEDCPPTAQSGVRALLRRGPLRLLAFVLAFVALAALWRYTPLAGWVDASRITALADRFADYPWAPLVILAAYTPACVVMFPRPLITLAAVVAFGPRLGFVYAVSGILLAAFFTYLVGLRVPRRTVRKLGGERLMHIADTLRRRSLMAMTAVRLVPLAPFAVVGLTAAAIGIRLPPYLLGTLFGMLPGTLATTVFGEQLEALLHDPSKINYGILAAAVVAIAILSLIVRRWLVSQHHRHSDYGNADADQRAG